MIVDLENKPIFIGGTGRSGTTVLMHMFWDHSEVLCFNESKFMCAPGGLFSMVRGVTTYEQFKHNMLTIFKNRLNRYSDASEAVCREVALSYTEDVIEDMLVSSFEKNISGMSITEQARKFVSGIYGHGLRVSERKRFVDKTPHTVTMAGFLETLFPGMKYIHVIREPKDVYCSVVNKPWGPDNIEEFIDWYVYIMQAANFMKAWVPEEDYFVVGLESLVEHTYEILSSLLELVSMDKDSLLDSWVSMVSPENAHIGRWCNELSEEEALAIADGCDEWYRLWKNYELKCNYCRAQPIRVLQ